MRCIVADTHVTKILHCKSCALTWNHVSSSLAAFALKVGPMSRVSTPRHLRALYSSKDDISALPPQVGWRTDFMLRCKFKARKRKIAGHLSLPSDVGNAKALAIFEPWNGCASAVCATVFCGCCSCRQFRLHRHMHRTNEIFESSVAWKAAHSFYAL